MPSLGVGIKRIRQSSTVKPIQPKLIDEEYLLENFSDDDIRETIIMGTDKMPSQRNKFTDEQINEIIKYLRYSQKAAGLTSESEEESEDE